MSVAITATSVPADVFATDYTPNQVELSEDSSEWENIEEDAFNVDVVSSTNEDKSNDSIKLGACDAPELRKYHFEKKNGGDIEVLVDEAGNEV